MLFFTNYVILSIINTAYCRHKLGLKSWLMDVRNKIALTSTKAKTQEQQSNANIAEVNIMF